MNIIQMKNIYKEYRGENGIVTALEDVSLEIVQGELVAITGISGSGKSTLLNIIGGLDRPTRGELYYNRHNVKDYPNLAQYRSENIGFVVQDCKLLPLLTLEENICLPLRLNGQMVSKKELDGVIKKMDLEEQRRKLGKQLTFAEQQRTAIARAIICKPKVLLADEPTGNLDPENRDKIIGLLRQMNGEGQTIVIATDKEYIVKQCDRRIDVVNGRVVKDRTEFLIQNSAFGS